MTVRFHALLLACALGALAPVAAVAARPPMHNPTPDYLVKEARAEAEADTGGQAVSARWARLPRSLKSDHRGVEVLVHMPGENQGWRVWVQVHRKIVVHSKERIPNPAVRTS